MVGLLGEHLGPYRGDLTRSDRGGVREPLDGLGNVDTDEFEHGRREIDTAEEIVIHERLDAPSRRRPDDQRNAGALGIQGGFRPRERQSVVGDEHDPGGAVEPQFGHRVQQPAHRRIRLGDRAVQACQIFAYRPRIGQEIGDHDALGVGVLVLVGRIRPVGLEETGRQQERSRRTIGVAGEVT